MSQSSSFFPQAIADIADAYEWFWEGGGTQLANRFRDAVYRAAEQAASHPMRGHRRPDLLSDPYRFARVKGFSYLLISNASRAQPHILRVVHMARDLKSLVDNLEDN